MIDLRPIVEPVVTIVGIVLIIAGTLALVLNLLADVLKAFGSPRQGLANVSGFGDWITKLPERYLVPTIVLLFGILLADPALFATYGAALFGTAPPAT